MTTGPMVPGARPETDQWFVGVRAVHLAGRRDANALAT
jgi:hypothetical protein